MWSLISEAGVRRFPALSGIECLCFHDPAGIKAARTVADRWQAAGAEAFLITPFAPRADLNDIFGARHA